MEKERFVTVIKSDIKTDKPYHSNQYIQLGKEFNVIQKRTIHFVVKQLQNIIYELNDAQFNNLPINRTTEGDCYFYIPTKMIDPHDDDTKIRRALKGLQIPIDDKSFIGNFMLSAERRSGHWCLLFPRKTVNFLTEVSKGITPLQTVVYLTAKSLYTIRFYEFCMQFRLSGKWYTTPEDLCDLLDAKKSYRSEYGNLRKMIIEPAQKELAQLYDSNQSDVKFSFEEVKGGRGNKCQQLIFSIISKDKAVKEQAENPDYEYVMTQLTRIMVTEVAENRKKKNIQFINKAISKLLETEQLKHFAFRLENRVVSNSDIKNKGAMARKMLIEDYGVELT